MSEVASVPNYVAVNATDNRRVFSSNPFFIGRALGCAYYLGTLISEGRCGLRSSAMVSISFATLVSLNDRAKPREGIREFRANRSGDICSTARTIRATAV